ncbi:MAG TPA: hypothetical protein VI278_11710 [Nitrososphaeraceae archaeon]
MKTDLWRRLESGQRRLISSFPDGSKKSSKIWIELQRTPSTILINKEGTSGRVIFEANSCQVDLIKVLLRE